MSKKMLTYLTMFFVVILFNACSDKKDPVSSNANTPARILVLEDAGTEDSLYVVLNAAGFTVTDGGIYYDYTGTDFSAFDLVIILNGVDYGYEIEDSVQQAMKDYVSSGGVLLTIEWALYSNYWDILNTIMPVAYNGDYEYLPETYTKMVDHAITQSLPDTFTTNADWTVCYMTEIDDTATLSTNRTVLFQGSIGGLALTIGNFGTGHIVHWSMAGEYNGANIWSDEVKQIFVNIGKFSE